MQSIITGSESGKFFGLSETKLFLMNLGKTLAQRNLAPATASNYSLRLSDSNFLITASGCRKGELTPDDFVNVDFKGQILSGENASSDTLLHLQLYQLFPETGWVIHVHSIASTVLTRKKQHMSLTGYELLKVFPKASNTDKEYVIPIFEGDDREHLQAQVRDYYTQVPNPALPFYFLRAHGIFLWGEDHKQILNRLEAINFMLECELLS